MSADDDAHQFAVTLEKPFGMKIGGTSDGTFVASVEEKGHAGIWNASCEGDVFDQERMIKPGDFLVGLSTSVRGMKVLAGKSYADILAFMQSVPVGDTATIEFKRPSVGETTRFKKWCKTHNWDPNQ